MSIESDQNLRKGGRKARLRRIGILGALAGVAIVLFVSLVVINPAMPERIRLLTGPAGSAYHTLGQRYATELEERGLTTEVIVTDGGFDNIRRLAAGEQDSVAFAPSAIGADTVAGVDASRLVSLGSVGIEPLWLFYRAELDIRRIADLAGLTIATAGPDTVSDTVARKLIEQSGLGDKTEIRSLDRGSAASIVEAILTGSVDAALVTGAARTPLVEQLLHAPGVSFLSFERAEAYVALNPGLTTVTAPAGVFDLARDIPPQNARLLAAATTLVASDQLSPTLAPLLLDAAADLQQRSVLSSRIDFPSRQHVGFPLDRSARRYFDQGQTGLSRFLPYKVTRWLNHLGFVVLPLLTLAAVLLKLVPTALRIWGQVRLTGLLKKLEAVEKAQAAGADRSRLVAELDRIDEASATMFVARSTVHDYIDFRQFLHDMRERVEGEEA